MIIRIKKKKLKRLALLFAIIFIAFGIYESHALKVAHSSFDNYYKFRGCQELLWRTEDYGICKLKGDKLIKIIKYQNKWYLDNDLPYSF